MGQYDHRRTRYVRKEIASQIGLEVDSLAFPVISHVISGQNEHRKCESSRGITLLNASVDSLKLEKDLHLSDNQYAVCLSVFFISYALFEAPSNVLLKHLRPHIWIPIIMTAWGVVMTLMAFVANFQGLAMSRFFLGLAEAGLYLFSHANRLTLEIPWDFILSRLLV